MSIPEVRAIITQGVDESDRSKATIVVAREETRQAHILALATVEGGQHDAIESGLHNIAQADHEAELVLRRLNDSLKAAEAYLRETG